jgi:hypothetical protein
VLSDLKNKTTYICPGDPSLLNRTFINTMANELYNHNASIIRVLDNVIEYIIRKANEGDLDLFGNTWERDSLIIAVDILSQYRSILILVHDRIRISMQSYTTVESAKEYIALCHFNVPFIKKGDDEFKIIRSFRSFLNSAIPESSSYIMFSAEHFTSNSIRYPATLANKFPQYSSTAPRSLKAGEINEPAVNPTPDEPPQNARPALRVRRAARRGGSYKNEDIIQSGGEWNFNDLKYIIAGLFYSCKRRKDIAGATSAVLISALTYGVRAGNAGAIIASLGLAAAAAAAAGSRIITQAEINTGINAETPTNISEDDRGFNEGDIDFAILNLMNGKCTSNKTQGCLEQGELYCYVKEYFPEIFTYAIKLASVITTKTPQDTYIINPEFLTRYDPVDDVKSYYWDENNIFKPQIRVGESAREHNKQTARAILLAEALINYYPGLKRERLTHAINTLKGVFLTASGGRKLYDASIFYRSIELELEAVSGMSGGKHPNTYSDEQELDLDIAMELYELHYSRLIKSAYTDIDTDEMIEEHLITILTYDKSIPEEYSKDEDYKYMKSRTFELIMEEYSSLPIVKQYTEYISDDFDRVIREFMKTGKDTRTLTPLELITKLLESNPELQANVPMEFQAILATGSANHEGGSRFRNLKYTRKTRRRQRKTRTTRVHRMKVNKSKN